MAENLYYPVVEFTVVALATLAYCFYKFPRTWKAGLGFIVASLFFAVVGIFSTWIIFHSYYPSMLLAGAGYYGMLFGAVVFGATAILESTIRAGSVRPFKRDGA